MEKWKPIKGYEKYYEVSNRGNIKSKDRYVRYVHKNGLEQERLVKGRILDGCTPKDKSKYRKVYMATPEIKGQSIEIHRLVAIAFVPNPDNKGTVDHINGNRHDNNADNLQWMTYAENTKKAWETGLCANVGPKHGCKIMCIETKEIFDSRDEASRKYKPDNLSYRSAAMQIGRCAKGKIKSAYGYTWKYL